MTTSRSTHRYFLISFFSYFQNVLSAALNVETDSLQIKRVLEVMKKVNCNGLFVFVLIMFSFISKSNLTWLIITCLMKFWAAWFGSAAI